MNVFKLGIIGAGKMGSAIAQGIIKTGGILANGAKDVMASCPEQDAHLLKKFSDLGCRTTHCNEDIVRNSDVIVLAVKPGTIVKVMDQIRPEVNDSKLIISIAAGVKLQQLQSHLGDAARVVRVMPNTPSLVQEGVTVYTTGSRSTEDDAKTVEKVFSAVGECYRIQEALIDAVTGISGSGPAYMYLIIEAMSDAGVKQGLPRDLSYKLAAQTMVGAGQMVLRTGQHPAVLKDDVCSPGGATIDAVEMLEKSGLRTALMNAVEAATTKCHTIGDSNK